ncbi:MAG: phytoene dehydrogenase-like protein [Candidatus Latescibacterota bacterium]|jgi:phytoene dehydrogenase-like protein
MRRRRFLQLLAASGGIPFSSSDSRAQNGHYAIPGHFANPDPALAHMLRREFSPHSFAANREPLFDVAIVGGGISGLCAAWKLHRSGIERIVLLEAAGQLGGTSISGERQGAVFPWGAHYINIPPQEAECVHEVLGDIGIIEGYDERGWPRVAADTLLRWPHERLYMDSDWQEGIEPLAGASANEREQILRFRDEMLRWALHRGVDGRRAFTLPLNYSSIDPRVQALDQIDMGQYLRQQGFDSPRLRWYVDYACRDDYGSLANHVSAWAGIHYFACRHYDYRLHDEYPAHTLTWPQGNAKLAQGLSERLASEQIRRGHLVLHIAPRDGESQIGFYDTENAEFASLRAKTVVYAGKLHTAPYVVQGLPSEQERVFRSLEYSPWLVAAIHLKKGQEIEGSAWDNVLYDSPSLGYIVADHQGPTAGSGATTLIYYLPFVDELKEARHSLLEREHSYWVDFIIDDLSRAEKNLAQSVERIDIYRWGHGMLRPSPGSLWGTAATWRGKSCEGVFFAGCDRSGLPLFEEALYAGIQAAEEAMQHLNHSFTSSLRGLGDG